MDGSWLNALARSFGTNISRRGVSAALGLIGLVAGDRRVVLTKPHHDLTAEKRKKRKRKKHKHKKRKDKQPQPRCTSPCTDSNCESIPASCPLFPADNIWNALVDDLEPDANSDDYVDSIGRDTGVHADFGSGLYEGRPIGIPFVVVPGTQPLVPIELGAYADESDPGPYPIPDDAPVEGGCESDGDRHVLVVESDTCVLYELFNARRLDNSWSAVSAATFNLTSHALRENGWTSADAAGLPILPGLVRFEEIEDGVIAHALRFTAEPTRNDYVWPARHQAGATDSENVPPMGQRFRLKAEFDIDEFSPTNRIILTALKAYGMILADNGGDWFLSGAPDERWVNDDLRELQERVHGDDFEAVDCAPLIVDPDSGEVGPA